jgi:hypothetical protein
LDSHGQPAETANETADNANAESDLLEGAVERASWPKSKNGLSNYVLTQANCNKQITCNKLENSAGNTSEQSSGKSSKSSLLLQAMKTANGKSQ